MEPLVYVNIILTLWEFVWALVGTIWTIREGGSGSCVLANRLYKEVPFPLNKFKPRFYLEVLLLYLNAD